MISTLGERQSRSASRKIEANRYLPALARGLVLGDFSLDDVQRYFRHFAALYSIGIDTNAICNLRCGYCYLENYTRASTPHYINLERLIDALSEECENNSSLDLIALVGKEPFADSRGPLLLRHLDRLSRQGSRFRYGVVTNGVLVDRYIDELPPSIAYVDVSLDGPADVTDGVRGKGVFEKATANIRALADRGFEVWVSAVLHTHSVTPSDLEEFMVHLSEECGCPRFYFSPIRNFTGSLQAQLLSFERITASQEAIVNAAERHSSIQRVILDHPYEAVWRDYFWRIPDGNDRTPELRIDEFGNILHPLTNRSHRKLDIFPHGPWGTCRIDAAGDYLWDVESRTFARPETVGNIGEEPLHTLHRTSLDSSLRTMLERFLSNVRTYRSSPKQTSALTTVSLPVI